MYANRICLENTQQWNFANILTYILVKHRPYEHEQGFTIEKSNEKDRVSIFKLLLLMKWRHINQEKIIGGLYDVQKKKNLFHEFDTIKSQ